MMGSRPLAVLHVYAGRELGENVLSSRRRALLLIATAELLAMSLWFSATAAAPELAAAWGLTPTETAWLTIAVQLGFVAGALLSAGLTLADAIPTRYLFAGSATLGAIATAAIAAFVETAAPAIALRFLTGVALAGVYPPGMKLLTGWFKEARGLAIGVLVGALSVGSALPHLIRAIGGVGSPRVVLYGAAGLALVGGLLALLVEPGPHQAPSAPFDPRAISRILRDRGTMLANGGYFGHMWELYAVWTWIPAYVAASAAEHSGNPAGTGSLLAFGAIAIGGVGAVGAGSAADRFGRVTVTVASMTISGACCLAAGLLFGASPLVLTPFVLLWGVAVVADSAQFSAAASELAEPAYVGTALTFQTAVGFLLTTVSIQLVAAFAAAFGWRWAFAPLTVGPLLGILSMLWLGQSTAGKRLAGS